MWALIVLLIPLCGYLYIESDPFLRYRLKKLDGWHAYFMAASHGILLAISLFVLILKSLLVFILIIFLIFFGAGLLSGVTTLIAEWSNVTYLSAFSTFFTPFIDMGIGSSGDFLLFWINLIGSNATSNRVAAVFSFLMVLYTISESSSRIEDSSAEQSKSSVRKEISNDNKVEAMIFEAERSGLLIMITLKSRKAYVGQVIGGTVSHTDGKEIAIIPILSGYRDKDTLSFKVEHDYSKHYLEEEIDSNSTPSLDQFRQIVFFDQIESMSLFDTKTYKKFQGLKREDITQDEHY